METANHVQNVAEYDLYTNISFEGKNDEEIKSCLLDYLDSCMANISPFLVDYIWQRDSFHLTPVIPVAPDSLPRLHGVTDFGDNIDDEWFLVFLLYQLTAAMPELVASVHDSDGEFLLIEAAYHLPKWMEPETSINRVFIYNGELHIIPKPGSPAELAFLPAGVPSISHAVEVVRKHSQKTLAKPSIREAVRARVNEFPAKVQSNFHHTHCLMPAKLAAILKHQPGLISPAVEAFYQRDPIDLKACRIMKRFAPENLVTSQVKFTRCLYAQLVQQPFQPDRRSGWKLPSPTSSKFKSADLGMKLAHGFEILCSRCHGNRKDADPPDIITSEPEDLATGARWEKFLQSLTEKGFFRGELEGSKLYNKLIKSAKQFYASIVTGNEQTSQSWLGEPGHQIMKLLETVHCDITQLKNEEKNLPKPDSDRWMELDLEELDDMIAKAAGKAPRSAAVSNKSKAARGQKSGGQTDEMDFDPGKVTESLKSFVDAVSGLKGAEFPAGGGGMEDVAFNPEEFEQAMRNILALDFRAPNTADDSDSDSDLMRDKDYQSGDDTDDDDEYHDAESGGSGDGGCHGDDEGIRELMEQMDRELARTEVGKSFEREGQAKDDLATHPTMEQPNHENGMDTHGPSHSTTGRDNHQELRDDGEEEDDEYRPVEVDVNLLKNILESYSSQQGLAGPASNILYSMGVHVPMNADDGDR
ncbi:protein ecdysoneless homolog [Strongylocentrotus purpuratus]|uniref:Ecdysoneless homolog n=1 Tax=Strongylocentrotus purpuratus TaxID=7668 RepID=A0A7M7NSQ9_STRPU|nr:protein ecdysoneless homolog [Strongylocentrotus purpuratus]